MNKKITLWLLLFFWCGLIFFFSSQPAGDSSELSSGVTKIVVEFISNIKKISAPTFSNLKIFDLDYLTKNLETLIRKCAHFGIFFILGTISLLLSNCYFKRQMTKILLSLIFCILYAATDEIHQIFVPGRSGSVYDVGIDSFGALCGIIITMIIAYKLQRSTVKY